jgi:ketosteroid isomerase-like protein
MRLWLGSAAFARPAVNPLGPHLITSLGEEMSEAREILDRAIGLWNDHDKSAWSDLLSDDIKVEAPGFEGSGVEAAQTVYSSYQDAFADANSRMTSTYVDGDTVIQLGVFTGTHTGTLNAPGQAPIEATNKKVSIRFASICTVRNGKINRWTLYSDRAEVMEQLGAAG